MEKIKVPEIRLEGFEGEWKRCDLEHIAIVNPKENLPDVFEYVDLESVVATKMIFHRTENKNTAPSRAQRLAKKGDIFFQTVRPYQKNNFLFEGADNPFVFSTGYAQIRTEVNGKFLLNVLQSATFVNDVITNCKGTGYPAINPNDLAVLPFYIPVDEIEQKAIGEYFTNLDNLIYNAEDRHTKLLALKKSLLQKMFPQEGESVPQIRFEGFEGEWDKKKLGTIAKEIVRKDASSHAPVMMISAASGFIYQSDRYSTNNAGQSLPNYTVLRKNELAYNHGFSNLRPFGSCFNLKIEEARVPFVYHCFSVSDNNSAFISMELNSYFVEQQLRKSVSSTARMDGLLNISFEDYATVEIFIPHIDEQQKIADYFDNLDTLIESQEQKITKLQQMKSALLQKMFV